MSVTTTKTPPDWPQIVADAERRNGTVELRIIQDDGGRSATARSRLLRVDANGEWLMEKPFSAHGPSFGRDMQVVGVVGSGSRRLGFHARVKDVELFQLNTEKRIPVLRLTSPTDIHSAQRRAYFRVSAVGADVPVVKLWTLADPASAVDAEQANQRAHDGETTDARLPAIGDLVTGSIFDISGNGMSLMIEAKHLPTLNASMHFWAELRLPGDPQPIQCVLKRIRLNQEQHGPVLAAFTFDFSHNRPHQRFVTDLVCRFTTAQQRIQLQRQR